jgi:hypothetical protein
MDKPVTKNELWAALDEYELIAHSCGANIETSGEDESDKMEQCETAKAKLYRLINALPIPDSNEGE